MKYRLIPTLLFTLPLTLLADQDKPLCSNPSKHTIEDKTQKASYKNCLRHGMTWWFRDDGKVKSEVNFINGEEEGPYISYYDNGEKRLVVNYVKGQKDGLQQIYYDNGMLGSEVNYSKGRREGVMTEWDIKGNRQSEVYYKNNYKVGIKKYFNEKGDVIRTEEYKMDRNPVVQKMLKDKRKEILIDLSQYGLVPKNAPEEERMK
jgi:antitoxin component YwqK of YwqJK toxin-antitoxin module